jgi:hypothetical protein
MRQGAAKPVQALHDEGVATAQVRERLREAWPMGYGAGDRVGVDLVAAGLRQGVLLEGKSLVKG